MQGVYPPSNPVAKFALTCRSVLLPQYYNTCPSGHPDDTDSLHHESDTTKNRVPLVCEALATLRHELTFLVDQYEDRERDDDIGSAIADVPNAFLSLLPSLQEQVMHDIGVAVLWSGENDPLEVIMTDEGLNALHWYRVAHMLYQDLKCRALGRLLSEYARTQTGIDIHPAARIGKRGVCIEGYGVVIQSRVWVGDDVIIGHRVTLATNSAVHSGLRAQGLRRAQRHKIDNSALLGPFQLFVEDGVALQAHATVWGDVRVGSNAVVGGNVWVADDVPPGHHISVAQRVTYVSRL